MTSPVAQQTDFQFTYPEPSPKTAVVTGSIMDNGVGLFPTKRIYQAGQIRVGDIITVILDETAQASRTNGITAERESSNDVLGAAQAEALFSGDSFFDGISTGGSTLSSVGTGVSDQSASLRGSITAAVVDVLANGNLVILGEKELTLTEGSEVIRVKGLVRPEDIQPNNTVLSHRIASAQISYSGTGDLARAIKPGWGTKILFGLWPF
ncbi:MAG: flagellar basal body L-ring protein FlgH [Proteobacteria bacterium]|nr:flagellar basal body L-ring protein FlgH [Pseudomonadota bacterium]MDA0928090.1 flagellar basal body L-ring protein FlgH [Pseudomonadota bacterium]